MPANLENSAVATRLEKVSFHSSLKEGQCQRKFKLPHNCIHPHAGASKVMLRILQARLQQYVNREIPHIQVGFRKGRRMRDQVASIRWIIEKAREFQKNIYFCFTDYAKTFDCVDHNKLWKIVKEMGIPDHLTCLLWNLYAATVTEATVRPRHGTMDCLSIGKGVRHSKNEDHGIWSRIEWGNNGNSDRLYFLMLWYHCGQWQRPWN